MAYKKGSENTPPKQKKRSGLKMLAIVLAVLVLAGGAGAALVFTGALESMLESGTPPVHYYAEGDVAALRLAPTAGEESEGALREYYTGAVQHAVQNGLNTIIYEAKDGLTVYWRDKIFPAPETVTAADGLFGLQKLDPLALLVEEAANAGVQVWVAVDAYATGGAEGLKGSVAKLVQKSGEGAVDAASSEYNNLLAQSIAALPTKYGIAGVVFTGLWEDELDEFGSVATSIHQSWQAAGYGTQLILEAVEGQLSPAGIGALGSIVGTVLLATTAVDNLSEELAEWGGGANLILQPEGAEGQRILFTALSLTSFEGAVYSAYPATTSGSDIALLKSAATPVEGSTLPLGYQMGQTLQVTNPADGGSTYFSQLYVMGLSDPNQPLYMDGEEVERTTQNGAFGVLVNLELGENTFVFAQNDVRVSVTIMRKQSVGGTGGSYTYSTEAVEGLGVQVTDQFTSALTAATGGSINETFYRGATAVAQNVVLRNGSPYAYQLTSGDYLLASAVSVISQPQSIFTGLHAEAAEDGEWIVLEGNATPAAYVGYGPLGSITITMYDTRFDLPEDFSSELVQGINVSQYDTHAELTLSLNEIWGYSLEYQDGTTRLYLKRVPTLSDDAAQPLAGITIMLDAGHGDEDYGLSGGVISQELETGPYEKDLNLAVAQATAYRLRQLGATVVMTRDDDSFTTIYERLAFENEEKPDMYISFHHNALDPDRDLSTASGTEVWYYHPYDIPRSQALAENLVSAVSNATGSYNRGVKWGSYVVVRTTVCPSVLCEFGFMGNPEEFEHLISTDTIYTEAEAVVQAILETFRGGQIPVLN